MHLVIVGTCNFLIAFKQAGDEQQAVTAGK